MTDWRMAAPLPVGSASSGRFCPPGCSDDIPGTTGSRGIGSLPAGVVRMPPLESTLTLYPLLLIVVMPLRLLALPLPAALLDALPPGGGAAVRICGWSLLSKAAACGSARTEDEAVKFVLKVAQPSSGPAVFRCAYT